MDLKLLRNLVRLMERGEVNELEIDDEKEGLRIHIKRGSDEYRGLAASPVVNLVPSAAGPVPMPGAIVGGGEAAASSAPSVGDDETQGLKEITSPMVGTFYRSPSPDAEAFVDKGATIDDEMVVCIIEAMKVMNEIKAECRGEIVDVLVESGEPVEFGQPLFIVKTD